MPEHLKEESLKLTRRRFLQTAAVAGGAVWAGSSLGCTNTTNSTDGEVIQSNDEIFNGVCKPNCFHACQLKVHVRDGKVVKTSMAPFPNPVYNRICLRGLSHVDNIYDPERVKYPMKRAGERGEDKWEQITWEEAITEIADKFTSYQKEFGPQSVMVSAVSGNYGAINGGFSGRFFKEINASTCSPSVDIGNAVGLNRVVGWAGTWTGNEARDLVNAKNVFVWANNVTDAQIHEWQFFADALEAGVNVIVIDPTFTQLAAKCSKFVPIRPASDTALIMGMINTVIQEDLIDREFMQAYTVAPFLVRADTGEFLRMSALGVEPTAGPNNPTTGAPTTIDPVAVWSQTDNAAVTLEGAKDPALEGEFTANGILCHTAYTLLKNEAAAFTPEYAESLCEVPAATIVELARLSADGPVTHRVGWGSQAYDNGVHPSHAGATLAAITGQMCEPGKQWGNADINGYTGFNSALGRPTNPVTSPSISTLVLPEVMKTGKFKGQDIVLKALYHYQGNPLCTAVNSNDRIENIYKKFEFIVTVDSMMTDTARYSDIVLPCAQFFEYLDVVGSGNHNHVILSEKAIDPPFEAKPDTEIIRMLAEKMGITGIFPETNEEWLQSYVDTETSAAVGITFEKLKQEKCMRWQPLDPLVRWTDHKFLTPSGRMEFYVEKPTALSDQGQTVDLARERLPRFFPPGEAWPEDPLYEKYPFVLMSERPRFRVHGQWASNKLLRELDPEPTVKINPSDASKLGIKSGDHVECYNDRGHAVAMASLNEAIRPGTLVYPKSWQMNQHIAGGWSELSSSSFDPVMVNQSFMDVLCNIRPWTGGGN